MTNNAKMGPFCCLSGLLAALLLAGCAESMITLQSPPFGHGAIVIEHGGRPGDCQQAAEYF